MTGRFETFRPVKSSAMAASIFTRISKLLRPDREHGMASATALMMSAVFLSSVTGFLRSSYIAWRFGAGMETDAYVAAFTLPDLLNYLAAGGAVSITFITLLTRGRAENKEAEVEKAFHVVLTIMSLVLIVFIVAAMWFAPEVVHRWFPKFTNEKFQLCVHLTRILLPAQLFFYVGGVVSAVQFSQRKFLLPAFAPLIYNVGIIAGGVFLSRFVGIDSLAIGALVGSALGPFLVNAIGAARSGASYRLNFNISNPMFKEWLRLTIPLMLGFTVVAVDEWIMRYFASGNTGDISRINYAKTLFRVPVALLGQAAGQASLPFFSQLFNSGKREEFSKKVSENIGNIAILAILASGWMILASEPLTYIVFRHGNFSWFDAGETSKLFTIFAGTLVFWSIQNLYARAFYASGDTFTPMFYGTWITVISIPFYAGLYFGKGAEGLATASNVAIIVHTIALAYLLDYRGFVKASDLPLQNLGLTFIISGVTISLYKGIGYVLNQFNIDFPYIGITQEILKLVICTAYWATFTLAFAKYSKLPIFEQLKRKLRGPANSDNVPS